MPKANPTGRLDILAIRLLDRVVETRAGLAESLVYQHFKRHIHGSIRRYLGGLTVSERQLQLALQTALEAARANKMQEIERQTQPQRPVGGAK